MTALPPFANIRSNTRTRFRKAERQFIAQFVDTTQINQPIYPKTLKAYGSGLEASDLARELKEITDFVDRLKELPHNERQFAIQLAERMDRNNTTRLRRSRYSL